MKSSTLTNKVAVQHEEKPQCILLSSGAVVDDFRGTDANPFFQTTLCACSVSFGKAHAPSSRTTMGMKKKIFNQTEMQTVPRRHQPRLVAGDWASQQNTMRYFLVGCFHSASQHGGEAIAPCLAPIHLHSLEAQHRDSCTASLGPRASAKDASVHLAANLAPLRRIVGFRAFTQHERLTLLRYIEDVRGAICLETMPPTHGNAVTTIPLPGDAVLDEMRRVCCHMEIFPHHTRVSHAEQRIFVCDTVSCDGVGVFQPRHIKTLRTVSDDRPLKRPAPPWDHMAQAAGRTTVRLSLSMRLDPLRCHLTPRTAALPVGPHRTAAGSLACSCRAERLFTKHGHGHFFISPPGGSIPIAHTSSCRHRCPLGDGITPPWPAGGARRRHRRDLYRAASTGGSRSHCWLRIFLMTLRNPTQSDSGR
ncbi:hypothetical protein TcCL_ESM08809 [Trypanosoma cruzi]|uniref:Uncharacterized protein n=1 Tax=Trypanosoma cruzi (strain CL Brener) TaxID=353153 RepID=Q4E1I9_TRYCC|nr:hypothetical protein, conserved [Trypanosoma cruzi]EAN98628.1 hypothetical protein, conserved [Trypanosoma cruzi]RNC53828.1 hypothetical protein TcCL_ESM08809 [Trypanosoma cruzi]|eukprot:XP_820479.1 hypothetical protein [Trypanosoma cruzi strain CL Brener]